MQKRCIIIQDNYQEVLNTNAFAVLDGLKRFGYFFDEVSILPFYNLSVIKNQIQAQTDNVLLILAKASKKSKLFNVLKDEYAVDLFENHVDKAKKVVFIPLQENGEKLKEGEVEGLKSVYPVFVGSFTLRMVNAPQEEIERAISLAKEKNCNFLFDFSSLYADQKIEVFYPETTAKNIIDETIRTLLVLLKNYVYAMDDTPLEERVYQALLLHHCSLSVAESFTGGGIAKRLTSVSGASKVYFEGLNTYNEESKMFRLGVREETLKRYGAVSKQTAYEMAKGLFETSKCNVCVATTGLAGPSSDEFSHPVGLCFVSVGLDGEIFVNEYHLKGNRTMVTNTAINLALFSLYQLLQ